MPNNPQKHTPPTTPPPHGGGVAHILRLLVGWLFRITARLRHKPCPELLDNTLPPPSLKPLVVMLHGFQGTPTEFCYLLDDLRHAIGEQFDFVVVDTLDPGMGLSPDENVWRVDAYLREHDLQERELYFIGHSMGGLIARRYPHLVNDVTVRAMVLIATPNGGVNSWNLLPIHWLRSRGFHERINVPTPAQAQIRYLLIAGTKGGNFLEGQLNDGVVGLWSVASFAECNAVNASAEMRTYPSGHWALLRSKQVAHDIAVFLKNAELLLHEDRQG